MENSKLKKTKPETIKTCRLGGPSEEEIARCLSDVDHFLPAAEKYYNLVYEKGDEMRKVIPFGTAFYLWAAEYRAYGHPFGEGSVGLRKWFEYKSRKLRSFKMMVKGKDLNEDIDDGGKG